MNRPHIKITLLVALLLANIMPAAGVWLDAWPTSYIWYFYWAECALLGVMTVLLYAKHLTVFFIILGIALLIYNLTGHSEWSDLRVPVTFWSLYSLCWLAYFELGNSRTGQRMKRWHPLQQFFFYLVFMLTAIAACFSLTLGIYHGWDVIGIIPQDIYIGLAALAAAVPTAAIMILKIVHIIGEHHFLHFLFGTYHRPVEKDRIVLFMDMVGSSKIAEKLTPKDSMALISRFIFDATAIIRRHGGDILNYTGDGLVVLWPMAQADKAVGCVYAMRSQFEKTRHLYEREFGVRPYFRMGLHGGKVVISQIGEEKLFLGLYGDTVNTAARLEQMNKELNTKVLLSRAVAQWLSPAWQDKLEPLGMKKIPGRAERVEIFTLPIKPHNVSAAVAAE